MTDPELTKLIVNLTPPATTALNDTAERTGFSRTDVVNRALLVYAAAEEIADTPGLHAQVTLGWQDRPVTVCVKRKRRWRPW